MKAYLPYIAVTVLFILLFLRAGGGFRAAASLILRRFPECGKWMSQKTLARVLMILLAFHLLGIFSAWQTRERDTAARGYLKRGDYGAADTSADLTLTLESSAEAVSIPVPSRRMTAEEIGDALGKAAGQLEKAVLGDLKADHVNRDVSLPETLDGLPVRISWMTDNPDVIGWDGKIGEEIPDAGCDVTLTAAISCEDRSLSREVRLRVFPRAMSAEEKREKEIQKKVAEENSETASVILLPETIDGKKAVWSAADDGTGGILFLLGVLTAVFYVMAEIRKREQAEKDSDEKMLREYPQIVNRLVLLLTAGLSLRSAFEKMAAEGGYEQIRSVCRDMRNGMTETESYERMGRESRVREYRTLSSLLVQNLSKGGDEMMSILKKEAEEANENRRRRARALGEEAGTKILFPMLILLVIVMVILMMPAALAFF